MFRGVLLGATRPRFKLVPTMVLNGLIFGAFHVPHATAFRFLPSAILGMLLAWVVLRTRSIWTGALMHFVNNGSIVLLTTSPWILERFADQNQPPPVWLLLPALGILVVGGLILERSQFRFQT